MKKLISSLLFSLFSFGIMVPFVPVQAATNVTQFEITAPATATVNEAIDVTVKAVDSSRNVVTSYRGSIIFIANGFGDTVPMQGKSILFTAQDNGEKRFSKGVIFKSAGRQKIYVTDLSDDNLTGETTVTVSPASNNTGTTTRESVTIMSPTNDTKIMSDTVAVSGNTRKNSKVNIKLNNILAGSTVSDSDGIFTKTISGITQQTNIISAEVLDANNAVIGTSPNVSITRGDATIGIFNVTISPSTTVEISSPLNITVEADPGLPTVNIEIDGVVLQAKEGPSGKYSVRTVAPIEAGTYPINVSAVNALGTNASRPAAAQLTVIEPSAPLEPVKVPSFKNVQALTEAGGKITFTFGVENLPTDLDKFKIVYGDSPDGFSSETITNSATSIRGNDGLYHWYIDKLTPKTYYFKIFGMRSDGTLIDALSSDALSATIGKDGCVIGNVGNVSVETLSDKSILSWNPVTNAVSYNLYKVSPSGEQTLFQNVKDNRYVLFLSKGSVVYENFAVKALCDNNTESATPALVSRVQTGPASLAILVILSGVFSAILLRKRVG